MLLLMLLLHLEENEEEHLFASYTKGHIHHVFTDDNARE
jgi:hypothetical protein